MSRAVFFDRDDTLIACRSITPDGDLGDPAQVRLLDGAKEACAMLKSRGYALGVITNQGGVARGRYTEDDVRAVHNRLNDLLDGAIDTFRHCPYHPKGVVKEWTREHFWRKPSPGMLLDAAEELDVSLSESWMVGDAPRDMAAGQSAGCKTVLLVSPEEAAKPAVKADFVAPSLLAAARLIAETAPTSFAHTSITLRALSGKPLREKTVREMVVATAHAIAERNGVKLVSFETSDDQIIATLSTGRLAAVGFAAELRRLTGEWYLGKYGVTHLWGEPGEGGPEDPRTPKQKGDE